ncbi:hypothetical protein [Alicyclobacillus sp.]|uniref:hypothetical protein n=1 Tax=Alicyclobacillus sp. TaxID=61169 RepID=UPI0025C28341|nr:hypothetical protein [Alicyclobacillus sp.]MCL6515680.1 hypothetical protein [Alicyclobacillus sp.]
MQWNSLAKFGSLMFHVAQDEKVQELVTMIHRGAKRRGWIGPPPAAKGNAKAAPGGPGANDEKDDDGGHPIPFAPGSAKAEEADGKSKTSSEKAGGQAKSHAPAPHPFSGPLLGAPIPWNRYVNRRNARRMLTWAGELSQLLIDKK